MKQFEVPLPTLQLSFYKRLERLRKTMLLDALLETVRKSDIHEVDQQLGKLVSRRALQKVAGWGIRGEIIFPTPYILEQNPRLLGYYRLLLGFSQKQFYGSEFGFGIFKSMEVSGKISPKQIQLLEALSKCLSKSANYLVMKIQLFSNNIAHELTLLTLGPQLRGGALNVIGTEAIQLVYNVIKNIVINSIVNTSERSIEILNAAGRKVLIKFASDPDIRIREELPSGKYRNLVAVEIKGGIDKSNIHNRLGESEKSHQKARKDGFVECWTIIRVTDLDMKLARRESPSTDRFYNIDEISRKGSGKFEDFRENLCSRVGIGYTHKRGMK